MTDDRFAVEHRPEESRYVLIDRGADGAEQKVIGEESYLDVDADGRPQRIFHHTFVSEEYSGQGLASSLVRAAMDDLTSAGFDVVPVCPYVAAWLPKHPEYADHVVQPTPDHLQALRNRR